MIDCRRCGRPIKPTELAMCRRCYFRWNITLITLSQPDEYDLTGSMWFELIGPPLVPAVTLPACPSE